MSTAKELTIIEQVKRDPAVIDVQNRVNEVKVLHQEVFQRGVHYGSPYKGSKNDTLLKPGATFLQQKYGLRELHERIETTIVVDKDDLSKSYIIIQDRCRIFNADGIEIAQADAACTTFEDKYLYRGFSNKVCPKCGGEFIIKGKEEYGGGWLCFKNKGGCGEKFKDNDASIVGQDTGKKINDNPLNLLDTIVAMAQKRASVRSTIKATGVDALFSPGDGVTVDFYDDVFDNDELTKAGDELIKVVQKNAPDTSKTDLKPPSSDAAQKSVSDVTTPENAAEAAKSALAGNGAPANGSKKQIGKEPPKDGEVRDFNTVSVTVKMKDDKPRYAITATDNTVIWAYSRDVFRNLGYTEDVIAEWGSKEQTIKFEQKMPVTGCWKMGKNGDGGYWSAVVTEVPEKQAAGDIPF